MEKDVFNEINCKLVEIMNLIEHQKGFPILSKDIEYYIANNPRHKKLCEIYLEVANLRIFDEDIEELEF